MPMTRRKRIIAGCLGAACAVALILMLVLAERLMDLDTYKGDIVASVQETLKRPLSYQYGEVSLGLRPAFSFSNVRIGERDGSGDFLRAQRLTFRLALLPLLYKKVILKEVVLERAEVNLSRYKDGTFNISDLLEERKGSLPLRVNGVRLLQGRVNFTDAAVAALPLRITLEQTNLTLAHLNRGKACDFKLATSLVAGGKCIPVKSTGSMRIPAAGESISAAFVDAKISTGSIDAGYFLPYYGRYLPFRKLAGEIAVDGSFKGGTRAFRSKGEVTVSRLQLDYPQVFHQPLTPRSVKLGYQMELGADFIALDKLKANVDGVQLKGSCRLSDIHSKDLRIEARATSDALDFQRYHQFIPYGVIVKEPADFIEQKIRGGRYTVVDARLDGRVSQIVHMERGRNYDVLSVKARVEDGTLDYGSGVPLFHKIKGELELSGKDFILRDMSGTFGTAPFTLDGRITDYPLDSPCAYPFTMAMAPGQAEAAWLLGKGRGEHLTLTGHSQLKLKGDGFTSRYKLAGQWDLEQAAYSYPGLLAKPAGKKNALSFAAELTKTETKIPSLSCQLGSLTVTGSSLYRYAQGGSLGVELRTAPFQLGEIAPLVPALKKYQPSGIAQATVHGRGSGMAELAWTGDVGLSGISLQPSPKMKQVSALSGTVHLTNEGYDTPRFAMRLGSSLINGRGSLTGKKSPRLELSFASPALDLADLGLTSVPKAPLKAVQGALSYHDGTLQIASLSAQLGRSVVNLKGEVQDLEHPRIDVSISSQHLVLDDLAALTEVTEGGGAPRRVTLKANLNAAEGVVRDVPFKRLHGTAILEDKILYLQPLEISCFDGEVSAKVRADLGSATPRYQASFSGQRLAAEKVMHALGVKKQQLTGSCSLQGELTWRGSTSAEAKKSALGSLKLKVEQGSVKKFATLSKIFSILNVSQLLKFQLPDMVSGGMPFNRITGDIAVRDGVAATNNLYMDSNAINMTTVGKVDMVKNELDLTVGVQPLQTVDKIVSKIPVVGWILTGKDKSLVTTYFEARGHVEDPQVKAVPVKSLAKGVFNVFKRMFELPAHLITEVGQVVGER